MKISASFLGSEYIPDTLRKLNITDVDYIHVDVMDGKYVKGKTMPFKELATIGDYTRKRLDVHLMVDKPYKMIEKYASLNVFCITFHIDIHDNLEKIFDKCMEYGIKIGLAVNPSDDVSVVYPYLDKIDLVLLMSVNPGLPGQEFIKSTLTKVNRLKEEIKRRGLKTLISIDGGINLLNAKYLADCDILVSGSTIIKSKNYQDTINLLRKNN